MKKKGSDNDVMRLTPQLQDGLLNKDGSEDESEDEDEDVSSSEEDSNNDEVELHPNFKSALMNNEMETKKKVKYRGCKKYLHRCDLWILRPVLIYKYERQMMRQSQKFYQIFKERGDELEQDFTVKDKK